LGGKQHSTNSLKDEAEIHINPEYEALMPHLSDDEYEALKSSIKSEGLFVPIVVNRDGVILDGHHRFRACMETGLDPEYEVKEFPDLLSEKNFVIRVNLNRRQLSTVQKAELALLVLPEIKDAAENREKAGVTLDDQSDRGKSFDLAGKAVGLSGDTVQQYAYVKEHAPPAFADNVRTGEVSIKRAYKELKKQERRRERVRNEKPAVDGSIQPKFKLMQGDFEQRGTEIPDESISLIVTDGPYGAEGLKVWGPLSRLASRVLVPGGFLVAYTGQLHFPDILKLLTTNLKYYWLGSLTMKQRNLVNTLNVFNLCKPILVLYKEPLIKPEKYFVDLLRGNGAEKDLHDWQQGEEELYQVIDSLCAGDGLILDPMCGGGTTLAASLKKGHSCVGIDLKAENIVATKRRLEADGFSGD
jgi:site-specific DNA-methyltransferase (adenine-specific)